MDAKDFAPIEGKANHYLHPDLGVCAFRPGQTADEFVAEMTTPRAGRADQVAAAIAERQQAETDRQMLLNAMIEKATADFAIDDTADAELKAAAGREQTRLAAAAELEEGATRNSV